MLLSLCALAADNQSCQQRVGGFSVGEEKELQTGSEQRLPQTWDTQRKPDRDADEGQRRGR